MTETRTKPTATLKDFYPSHAYNCHKITDANYARSLLNGKTSASWANGEMADTPYTKLAQFSPNTKGDKSSVFYCLTSLLNEG